MFLGSVTVGLGRIETYKVMVVPPQLWSASSATDSSYMIIVGFHLWEFIFEEEPLQNIQK